MLTILPKYENNIPKRSHELSNLKASNGTMAIGPNLLIIMEILDIRLKTHKRCSRFMDWVFGQDNKNARLLTI